MKRLGLLAILPIGLVLASCDSTSSIPAGLRGDWSLRRIDTVEIVRKDISLHLDGSGSATGSDGCNTFEGHFHATGSTVRFESGFSTTTMACLGENPASSVPANLVRASSWSVQDSTLRFRDASDVELMAYVRQTAGTARR